MEDYKKQMDALLAMSSMQDRAAETRNKATTSGQMMGQLGSFIDVASKPRITQSEIMAKQTPQASRLGDSWRQAGQGIAQQGVQGYQDVLNRFKAQNQMSKTLAGIKAMEGKNLKESLVLNKLRRDEEEANKPIEQSRDYLTKMAITKDKAALKEKQIKEAGGKQLNPTQTMKISEGNEIPALLEDIDLIIEGNKDSFGPLVGRVSQNNPYDTKVQTIRAAMKATSQAFGRFMEGGVLRKEDEIKYEKMFPNLQDTHAVAKNKLAVVRRLLIKKQQQSIKSLKDSGYNTSALENDMVLPNIPGLGKKKPDNELNKMSDDEIYNIWKQGQ